MNLTDNTGILPVMIPTRGMATNVEIRVLPFTLPANGSISIYYSLNDENGSTLLDGNVNVPDEVVQQWGTDDNVIINYVLNSLELTAS